MVHGLPCSRLIRYIPHLCFYQLILSVPLFGSSPLLKLGSYFCVCARWALTHPQLLHRNHWVPWCAVVSVLRWCMVEDFCAILLIEHHRLWPIFGCSDQVFTADVPAWYVSFTQCPFPTPVQISCSRFLLLLQQLDPLEDILRFISIDYSVKVPNR